MDPFHIVRLAGNALDPCRQRVQQELHGHRGLRDDPVYKARRTRHTGADLLTDREAARIKALFTPEEHAPVEAVFYQKMVTPYRHPDPATGKTLMTALIESVLACVRRN